MNVIREASDADRDRILENFWASQLRSKAWLINALKSARFLDEGDVYIFGGWYGVLGSLIKDTFLYRNVYSIDIDPTCKKIGKSLDSRISFITGDMADFSFVGKSNVGLIINTSTEHVSQSTFNAWMKQVPENTLIILQGNNYFENEEHIRCSKNLKEFMKQNTLGNVLFSGELDCVQFIRYMTIGYK